MPRQSDDALSEVIGFILIIALITIFLSLWMTYVIPAEGRQQEIEHMNYVRDWFTQYKITADSLWINNIEDLEISNSIVLGSQRGATQAGGLFLPVMSPTGTTGAIAVKNVSASSGGDERIEITGGGLPDLIEPLWRLEYSATNNYWVPQSYYYQMGGVFLRQSSGTVARIAPLVTFKTGNIAEITIVRLDGSGQSGLSGQGPVRIDTKLSGQMASSSHGNGTLKFILSDDSTASGWRNILSELGAPAPNRINNEVTIALTDIKYKYVNYTVSIQSIASLVD